MIQLRGLLLLALLPLIGGCTAIAPANTLLTGQEIYHGYTWQHVGRNIYLHRRNDPLSGPIDGNSVVIVNDNSVYVVDTHIDPAAARAVIKKIRQLTDKPVTHVINTHWHDDHTNGNDAFRDAFPGVQIVSHHATLAALREEWPAMKAQRIAAYAKTSAEQLLAQADQLAPTEPDKAIGYRVYAGYVAALTPELPTLDLVYPDTVFDAQFVLANDGRTVVVEWPGPANTEGDVIVWLPKEKMLIAGDILAAPIPFAFDSPVSDWVEALNYLAAKKPRIIIPGHGSVQHGAEYIDDVRALLQALLTQVRGARAAGVPLAELDDVVNLAQFEQQFTGGDPGRQYAWNAFFLTPGLKSAWESLGYPVPQD